MDNGVFPGSGKFTGCETGVENEEKNVTDGIKTKQAALCAVSNNFVRCVQQQML